MSECHSHQLRENCQLCRSYSRSYRFGKMGMIIPDHVQTWINSQFLPYKLETIAKGLTGFEELKKYIRQGSDFCKDVALIIQERADLESTYSKNLGKIAHKLMKASQNSLGSLSEGWKAVSTSMELEADLHKNLGNSLLEDISKPLKHLVDGQIKARRPIESGVDKALKSLTDRRAEENRAKKSAYDCAKSHEKAEESKPSKNKTEKDINKTEKKQKQVLDALRKADRQYCELCEKAEVTRQEWEFAVNKASAQLQIQEEERIAKMSEFLNQYNSHISVQGPRLTQSCDKLNECVRKVDVGSDIQNVARERGSGQYTPEQILIDCYAEDKQFTMKPERRKIALQHYLLQLRQSIEREQKGREGVEKLVGVYKERPGFADQDTQQEAKQRLSQVIFMTNFLEANHYKIASLLAELDRSDKLSQILIPLLVRDQNLVIFMTNFLEANHYKIASSLAELDRSDKPSHKFSKYIEQNRDKQGMMISLLKLPWNLALEGKTGYDVNNVTVGALVSDDLYELQGNFLGREDNVTVWALVSDDLYVDDDFDDEPDSRNVIGRCRAIYEYQSGQSDELNMFVGSIINIYEKLPDGWWHGELNGKVGLFPATYVEEI